MARDGLGTHNRLYSWSEEASGGNPISSTKMDAEMNDMVAEISNSLPRDGQAAPTANLPMGGYKHTNVANATARSHYATAAQLQDGSLTHGSESGTTNSYLLTLAPGLTGYQAGQLFSFVATHSNSGAATININGLGAVAIKKQVTQDLAAGDIATGSVVMVVHDGSHFQLLNAATLEHAALVGAGSNTHAEIDAHLSQQDNPHNVTDAQVGVDEAKWNANRLQGVTVDNSDIGEGKCLAYDSGTESLTYQTIDTATVVSSGELTLSPIFSAGRYQVAHGLGGVPSLVSIYLVCVLAEHGYSVGQRLELMIHAEGADSTYFNASMDSNSIIFRFNDVSQVSDYELYTLVEDGLSSARLTASHWAIQCHAYRFL
ncbi:hypothetical protein Mmc1_1722 [Magnetococcus marinus MC-1]|uniref:Uncharacterized protein n=1 Tax=Magnetococcus marinus (strain ATCC BAA-1437 / JCM 17883 / MC-1) TaxID=156889 RepID=A0L8D7_MAGMM|nr:hypothetical protein [Magnetococcus marinus]ABK44230.1 hypothetical protein Mmc1_1722 [Magnetococcus marinus MC-1]